ncbi:MAG: nitroreductase family protein, partial [Streptosporangiales bacterium]|nr:nitroreductase family protein [Streptosporangiales bacterium]
QTDVAVGAAGLVVVDDHRGRVDSHGRTLEVTEIAIADEIAAATDLVKGKSTGTPVAVVRGLAAYVTDADGPGVRALVRPAELDMFSLGARDVLPARRTVREFDGEPVDRAALLRAVAAAVTAPAPFGTTPWRFVVVETPDARDRLLSALAEAWRDVPGSTARADSVDVLRNAPALLVACVDHGALPDTAEPADHELLSLSAGAAVQNLLVALAVEQLGSAWIAGPVHCPGATRTALDLPETWAPAGAVAVGRPHKATAPRDDRPPEPFVVDR